MTLKTIKELNEDVMKDFGHVTTNLVFSKMLKKEAIKLINELECQGFYSPCILSEELREEAGEDHDKIATATLKHFFNITEEELK